MIAITFALPAESSGILRRLKSASTTVSKAGRVFSGRISEHEVVIFHTGVGRDACRRNIDAFLESFRPQLLISSGFAGSVTDELSAGDLILAENFSDQTVVPKIRDGEKLRQVTLLTAPSMIDSMEERRRIAKEHSADAIDMETDVIAKSCASRGIPMVSLRVISDSPAEPFPAPPEVLFDMARQKTNFRKLLPYVITHPFAIGRLVRFSRQISCARDILTNALVDVVERTSSHA